MSDYRVRFKFHAEEHVLTYAEADELVKRVNAAIVSAHDAEPLPPLRFMGAVESGEWVEVDMEGANNGRYRALSVKVKECPHGEGELAATCRWCRRIEGRVIDEMCR